MENYINNQLDMLSKKLYELGYNLHVVTDRPIDIIYEKTIEPLESEHENVWIECYHRKVLNKTMSEETGEDIKDLYLEAGSFELVVIELDHNVNLRIKFTFNTIESIIPYLDIYFTQGGISKNEDNLLEDIYTKYCNMVDDIGHKKHLPDGYFNKVENEIYSIEIKSNFANMDSYSSGYCHSFILKIGSFIEKHYEYSYFEDMKKHSKEFLRELIEECKIASE